MTTNAFKPSVTIQVNLNASTVSPQNFVTIPEGTEVSFGETTPLLDATHYQSTSREYIGGLADGEEFSCTCNRVHSSPNYQATLIGLKGLTRTMKVTITDTSVSPNTSVIYMFDTVILGWNEAPPVGEIDKITFNFKISGGITLS